MSKTNLSANTAYETLYTRIIGGEIKPGERVREASVAAELGLSRTPVRDALRRLETEGLLVHRPHSGMTVRQLDHQAVTELYLMREVLEGTAAALAARHASDAEIAALQDMLAEQKRLGDNDPQEAARLNKLFHKAIYRGAHNRYLIDMLDGLALSMALLGRTTLSLKGRPTGALKEHTAIIEAIEAHDPERAREAAKQHIHAAHKARLRILFEDEE